MGGTGEEAAFGGAPELTRITAITTATAATTLPIITQTRVRPRRIGPPRPSCLSLGNLASSPRSGLVRLRPGDGGGPVVSIRVLSLMADFGDELRRSGHIRATAAHHYIPPLTSSGHVALITRTCWTRPPRALSTAAANTAPLPGLSACRRLQQEVDVGPRLRRVLGGIAVDLPVHPGRPPPVAGAPLFQGLVDRGHLRVVITVVRGGGHLTRRRLHDLYLAALREITEHLDAELGDQCPGLAIPVDEDVVPEPHALLADGRPDDAKRPADGLPQVLRRRHGPDRREPTRRGLLGPHLDGHDRTLSPGNSPAGPASPPPPPPASGVRAAPYGRS